MDGLGPSLAVNGRIADFRREAVLDATGAPVPLRPQAFRVLRHLATNPGRVVTKDELMAAVWPGVAVTDDSLVQCIHEIRRAIGDERHAVLKTVPRRGYLFEAPETRPAPERPRHRSWRGWAAAAPAVALAAARAAAGLWRPAPAPREVGIAVLSLRADAADPKHAGFAEALTDDIVTELSRARSLRVLARNSVASVEGPDAIAALRRLGADYVLEGRLDVYADQVRVAARLIDAESRAHVWSARFERPADDLFAIRDPLVTEIVGTISSYGGVIWKKWLARAERSRPQNLTAFELLIRAKESYARSDEAGIREARALIERSLDLDPELLIGWIFLAGAHLREAFSDWGDRDAAWPRFEAAVARAAALDPEHGRVLMCRALIAFRRGEVEAGRADFERALATSPNDVIVLGKIGEVSPIALGAETSEAALAALDRLAALDPLHPPQYWFQRAHPLYFSGRYVEAAAALRKLPHRWFEARLLLALSLAQAGEAADGEVAEILRLDPTFSAEAWLANGFYQPGSCSVLHFVQGARRAGLPICAADPAAIPAPKRLPDCTRAGRG